MDKPRRNPSSAPSQRGSADTEERLLELEAKYASLRREYSTLDADLEELIEKGYRKMHRYRMEEFREAEKQEKEKKRPIERMVLDSLLSKAVGLSSSDSETPTARDE